MRISRSSLFHSVNVQRKKGVSENVTPDFEIRYIIDLIASSRMKPHFVRN